MQKDRKVDKGYDSVLSQLLGLATPKVRNKNDCNMKTL
jgi:hypothetical protein